MYMRVLRGIQEGICAVDLQPYLVCHILQMMIENHDLDP